MQNFIIAYDIFNKKRLRQVSKIVHSYKLGGQKSSIESPLQKNNLKCLVSDLNYFCADEDKINIINVSSNPIFLGKASNVEFKNDGIIIL